MIVALADASHGGRIRMLRQVRLSRGVTVTELGQAD